MNGVPVWGAPQKEQVASQAQAAPRPQRLLPHHGLQGKDGEYLYSFWIFPPSLFPDQTVKHQAPQDKNGPWQWDGPSPQPWSPGVQP